MSCPPRARPLLFALAALAACAPAPPARVADAPGTFLGKPLGRWVKELRDPRPVVRRSAAFALGRMGLDAFPAAPELAGCLRDEPDAAVRATAAASVGDLALALEGGGQGLWAEAGPALKKLVADDPDRRARRAAAYALGAFGPRAEAAHAALRAALRDADPGVRRNAAWALGRLGGEAGDAAVGDVCDLLRDRDPLVRRDAAAALGAMGPEAGRAALRPLLALVKGERDDVVKRTALDQLVGLAGPDDRAAAPEVRPLLADEDPDTRFAAALVLGSLGGEEALPALPVLREALKEALEAGDEEAQGQAVGALGGLGPLAGPAVPELTRALTEGKSSAVREKAAVALCNVGPEARDAVPFLARVVATPAEGVATRARSANALLHIGYPANKEAVPTLLRVLREERDPSVRLSCAKTLGGLPDYKAFGVTKAFADILAETGEESRIVRYEAALYLAQNKIPETPDRAVEVLLDLLKDPHVIGYAKPKVQLKGGRTESSSGGSEVRPNQGRDARCYAAEGLGNLGARAKRDDVLAALREAAKDANQDLARTAKEALSKIAP
jgi:HEAT repeat protein